MLLLFLQVSNIFWLCLKFHGIFCSIFFSFLFTFLPSLKLEVLVKLLHWKRTYMCLTDPLEGRHVCGEFVQWEVFVFIVLVCGHESYEISCWHECQTWEHGGWQDTVQQGAYIEHHCLKNYDCGAMIEHFNILKWRNVGVPNATSVEQVEELIFKIISYIRPKVFCFG
jgi:hypothetical protein